jgi:hypothetical protein
VLPWRDLGGIAAVAAAAGLPVWALRSALTGPALERLAIMGLTYAAVYLTVLFHSGLLAEGERRAMRVWEWRWPLAAPASDAGRS